MIKNSLERQLQKQLFRYSFFPVENITDYCVGVVGCYEDFLEVSDNYYYENPRNRFDDLMCFIKAMGGYEVFDAGDIDLVL